MAVSPKLLIGNSGQDLFFNSILSIHQDSYLHLFIRNIVMKRSINKHQQIIISIFFLVHSPFLYCDDLKNSVWKQINPRVGLSNSNVFSILEDSSGYYWFGTSNGLNKYDGYNIVTYKGKRNAKNYLSHSTVLDMVEDDAKNIWVATLNGLNKVDVKRGLIKQFIDKSEDNITGFNPIRSLLYENNKLWIGSDEGLHLLNTITEKKQIVYDESYIHDIVFIDRKIWFAGKNKLFKYDAVSHEKNEFKLDSDVRIYRLKKHGTYLWLASNRGLVLFNTLNNQFEFRVLENKNIIAIEVDKSGDVYISTTDGDLYVYSYSSKSLEMIFSKNDMTFVFDVGNILNFYIDNKDVLWIAGKGVAYASLDTSLKMIKFYNNTYMGGKIFSVTKTDNNSLWLGTNQGVSIYSGNNVIHHKGFPSSYLVNTGKSQWLIGLDKIFLYDEEKNVFANQLSFIPDLQIMDIKYVHDILLIDKGLYLIATIRGLILWNQHSSTSQLVANSVGKLYQKNAMTVLNKRNNEIFVGSRQGFYRFDKSTLMLQSYPMSIDQSSLNNTRVLDIASDSYSVWIGTLDGLYQINNKQELKHFTINDGLPDNAIRSIEIVGNYIWLGTDKGLVSFDVSNGVFKRIYINNDIFDIEFNQRASYKTKDDYLYFGSMDGLLYFDPKEFTDSSPPPAINITDFHLFNKPVSIGSEELPYHIGLIDHIILGYHKRMLTFDFSSINYTKPNHIYAYQMQGLTGKNLDDWIITDSLNRKATFTPNPGEYVFRVKSGWDENTWSKHVKTLYVTILPPWWRTTWAYYFYALVVIVAFIMIHLIRTRSIRLRANELESKVKESTKEIKDLLKRKNDLFANVSHELRTPITLILGPVNELLKIHSSDHETEKLKLVKGNTQRLLKMIDQLLELSRLDKMDKTRFVNYSLTNACRFIVASIIPLADEKNIKLTSHIEDDVYVYVTENCIEGILFNLLVNAIKYTQYGGDINICVSRDCDNGIIIVRDTGIGIPDDEKNNIFKKFTRLNSKGHNIPGTGMGLAIVKELLEINCGSIMVESKQGVGSAFFVRLPLYQKSDDSLSIQQLSPNHQNEKEQLLSYIAEARVTEEKITHVVQSPISKEVKILIIEDTPEMNEYLLSVFCVYYECITVFTGEEGLDKAVEFLPDLIVCDVMLPGISGFCVIEELKQNFLTRHIPVVILTAKGDKSSKIKGLLSMADDYINKPFDVDELLIRVKNILGMRKQLQEYYHHKITQSHWVSLKSKSELPRDDVNLLEALTIYVDKHFLDADLTVDKMAEQLNMSTRNLQKKLKSLTGHTPTGLLKDIRLNKAAEYLRTTDLSLKVIAHKLLFSDAAHFSREFKNKFGVSPSQFQRQYAVNSLEPL